LKTIKRTAKLCLGYLDDFNGKDKSIEIKNFDSFDIIEQIFISQYIKYLQKIEKAVKEYDLKVYYNESFYFINEILLNYYLDVSKHFFINNPVNEKVRRRMQFVLKEIFYGTSLALTPVIPFNGENIYSFINFIENKKEYINLERLPTSEQAINIFKYSDNPDFKFNAENLLNIRKYIAKKDKRNELDLHIFNEEGSYEDMLLKSLSKNINYFFGVSHCYLGSELVGKRSNFTFKSQLPSKQKMKIFMEYSLVPSDKFKCSRCYFNTSNMKDSICESCERMLYKI
jgi:isoleucyl-tRNA synthetase